METIFGGLPKEYLVRPEHLSCLRMVFGKRYMGYGINPAQRDFIRYWTGADPEHIPDEEVIPIIFEHGMSGYAPDFEEPSLDRNKFELGDWMRCRDFWVAEQITKITGFPNKHREPPRYDEWLEIWGVHYQRRIEAAKNPHKED